MSDKEYIVDMGEEPGSGGAFTVTATARDGTVEKATFTGPAAATRAMAYVESQDDFEKRPPLEYPKHVNRGGRHHIVLDKKHEDSLGPETDEDKAQSEAAEHHMADEDKRQAELRDAHERMKRAPDAAGRRPEFIKPGEDDMNYSERVANWQNARRGNDEAKSLPPLEPVQVNGDPVGVRANAGFETDDTKLPTVEGMAKGERYDGVDNIRSPDGIHSAPGSDIKPRTESEMKPAPEDVPGFPGNAAFRSPSVDYTPPSADPKRNLAASNNDGEAKPSYHGNVDPDDKPTGHFNPAPR